MSTWIDAHCRDGSPDGVTAYAKAWLTACGGERPQFRDAAVAGEAEGVVAKASDRDVVRMLIRHGGGREQNLRPDRPDAARNREGVLDRSRDMRVAAEIEEL